MGTETEMVMCGYLYTHFPLCLLLLLPVLLLIVAGITNLLLVSDILFRTYYIRVVMMLLPEVGNIISHPALSGLL